MHKITLFIFISRKFNEIYLNLFHYISLIYLQSFLSRYWLLKKTEASKEVDFAKIYDRAYLMCTRAMMVCMVLNTMCDLQLKIAAMDNLCHLPRA